MFLPIEQVCMDNELNHIKYRQPGSEFRAAIFTLIGKKSKVYGAKFRNGIVGDRE